MSQHTFNTTTLSNTAVLVTVGFDRATDRFFYNVRKDGEVVSSSIQEPDIEFTSKGLFSSLGTQGIAVPKPLIDQLSLEAMFGGSNEAKEWPQHSATTAETALLALGFLQHMDSCIPASREAYWVLPIQDADDYLTVASPSICAYLPSDLLCSDQLEKCAGRTLNEDELLSFLNGAGFAGKVKEMKANVIIDPSSGQQ